MIEVLVGRDVCQQSRGGQPLVDRLRRLGCYNHLTLTTGAGILDSGVLENHQVGGDVFELIGELFADLVAFFTAAGAGLVGIFQIVFDADARQMPGKLAAPMGFALRRGGNLIPGCRSPGLRPV